MINSKQFIGLIQAPNLLSKNTIPVIENLIKDFPYCQSANMLYIKNLYKENHIYYNKNLKIAAAYSSDRGKLKQLINQTDNKIIKNQTLKKENIYAKQTEKYDSVYNNKESKSDRIELLKKQLEQRLLEIQERKSSQQIKNPDISLTQKNNIQNKYNITNNLIDKFIKENPRIGRPRKDFFNPVDLANKSVEDNDDIVSETLAKIYYDQGNNLKAIKIYKQLCLEFPKKNNYFANQIKIIKNNNKN